MLAEAGQWDLLQRYATGSNEPALLLWWGRYCESRGDMEGAVASYKQAGGLLAKPAPGACLLPCAPCPQSAARDAPDRPALPAGNLLALVRVLCAAGDLASAEAAVTSSGDAAAAFHLARAYEVQGRPLDAIRLYR
jgi:hypothetical protein